jgi:DNA-binding LacI/PurR family transcriptional regulator
VSERSSPTTIRDVALRAGVSTATVSRVLAGIGTPRPETAAAVRSAAEALGYRPSGVARSLRMRRTRTIGLIVTDIGNPFFPELVKAADDRARELGYSILLGSAAYNERRAMHYLDLMADRRVDGMIIASSQLSGDGWDTLMHSPVPVVVANSEPAGLPLDVITSDNVGGSRMAVEHLVANGHRRIAYIQGSPSYTASAARFEGFRAACSEAGLDPDETPMISGEGDVASGERGVHDVLAHPARVTALYCYNDLTAIGALQALRSAGRRVPADISVVGCDDIAAASWVSPRLTTLGQQKAEMGRLAVDRLIAALDDPEPATPATVRLPMTLHARESTGPVRPAAVSDAS